MATREMKVCDVYGTAHNVVGVSVQVARGGGEPGAMHTSQHADLSYRAYRRLMKFIQRGLKPPGWTPAPPPDEAPKHVEPQP